MTFRNLTTHLFILYIAKFYEIMCVKSHCLTATIYQKYNIEIAMFK